MTEQQFDPSTLLDALEKQPDLDLVLRDGRVPASQALIEVEATEVIGADRFERSLQRTTRRNGSRQRTLSTKAGDIALRIPKLRRGNFFPSVLERRRRISTTAFYAVVIEADVHGVSTRKVDDLVAALGIDAGISKSEVSRICAEMDEEARGLQDPGPVCNGLPLRLFGRHLRQGPRLITASCHAPLSWPLE